MFQDDSQFYWIIQYYYLGDLNYSIIAGRIHPYLYNFAFFELGLNKLYAEVMEGNEGMMKMHLHYGFTHTATFKEHIYKYGKYHDVEYFELLASTWKNDCTNFIDIKQNFQYKQLQLNYEKYDNYKESI